MPNTAQFSLTKDPSPSETPSAAVRLEGIHKAFGERIALDGVEFDVAWGEVHALLGENGAGKSTLMNIVAGFYTADSGQLMVNGESARFDTPTASAEAGIGMIHQHFKLVGPLTVLENIRLSCARICKWKTKAEALVAAKAMAERVGFRLTPDARVDQLSVSDQQKLEIIKVLLAGSRILIMDEPTAVLAEAEAEATLELARRLAAEGCAVILITHKLRDVIGFADRVTVMRAGKTVMSGAVAKSMTAPQLAAAMVGGQATPAATTRTHIEHGFEVLQLFDVSTSPTAHAITLRNVNFQVRRGEILGIAGVGGNGQSELLEALVGMRTVVSGEIWLNGGVAPETPQQRREQGLRFVPADRFGLGLFRDLTLRDNISLPRYLGKGAANRWWLSRPWMTEITKTAIRDFEVMGASPELPVRLLSGGNAQKLILARELTGDFSVLVVHSPTRGLDIRAVAAVQSRLNQAAEAGAAVLLISEDLDEVLEMSDRVAVMSHGTLSPAQDVGALDRQAIGRMMLGEGEA